MEDLLPSHLFGLRLELRGVALLAAGVHEVGTHGDEGALLSDRAAAGDERSGEPGIEDVGVVRGQGWRRCGFLLLRV